MFLRPITSGVVTTKIASASARKPCVSPKVASKTVTGRTAITVTNIETEKTVYLGGSDVTTSNGRPIAVGESVTIPCVTSVEAPCYVIGGTVILTEYF